jgi:hypothetical protein
MSYNNISNLREHLKQINNYIKTSTTQIQLAEHQLNQYTDVGDSMPDFDSMNIRNLLRTESEQLRTHLQQISKVRDSLITEIIKVIPIKSVLVQPPGNEKPMLGLQLPPKGSGIKPLSIGQIKKRCNY